MKYYLVRPEVRWHNKYGISSGHKWNLPAFKHFGCGHTYYRSGVAYPTVVFDAVPVMPEIAAYEIGPPVTEDRYLYLKEKVRKRHPQLDFLPPGTEFGPLHGEAEGDLFDFVWQWSSCPLMNETSFWQLFERGFENLVWMEADIRWEGKPKASLLEIEIPPEGELVEERGINRCPHCGRFEISDESIVLRGQCLPQTSAIFRLRNFPTAIIVNEQFAATVKELSFTNVQLMEVQVER